MIIRTKTHRKKHLSSTSPFKVTWEVVHFQSRQVWIQRATENGHLEGSLNFSLILFTHADVFPSTSKRWYSTFRISIMQSTGIKHTGPHSISAKQESSNTSSTLNAMKMGSEEKEKRKHHTATHSLPLLPARWDGERIRKVKVRHIMGWDKGSLTGKAKVMYTRKQKAGVQPS